MKPNPRASDRAAAAVACASALTRALAEAARRALYWRARGEDESVGFGSFIELNDPSFRVADLRRKSTANRPLRPTKRASSATRRSASKSQLDPSATNSFHPFLNRWRPAAVILCAMRPREPALLASTKPHSTSRRNTGIVAPGESPAACCSSYGVETPSLIRARTKSSRSPRRRLSGVLDTLAVYAGENPGAGNGPGDGSLQRLAQIQLAFDSFMDGGSFGTSCA